MDSLADWSRRLEYAGVFGGPEDEDRQLAWYEAHRKRVYRNVGIRNCARALEVGCGTGALTEELSGRVRRSAVGVDIRRNAVAYAAANRRGEYVTADAGALPFMPGTFDVATCAFTIMWLRDPTAVFTELRRALKEGGTLLIFAEPDYDSLTDEPAAASSKAEVLTALTGYGADTAVGKKIKYLALSSLFRNVNVGLLDCSWSNERLAAEEETEMESLRRLLTATVATDRIREIATARRRAIAAGTRRYYLPIYYLTATK